MTQILLVEDEEIGRKVMCRILSEFDVVTASNAEEALTLLSMSEFDVIISDYRYPGKMNGVEFLTLCADKYPNSRRILISASPPADSNYYSTIAKPFNISEIRSLL